MTREEIHKLPDDLLIWGDNITRSIKINGKILDPESSLAVRNHSPGGFDWGYSGSGPSQLALAILLEYLPVNRAGELYMDFKFDVIAGWPQGNLMIRLNLREEIYKIIDKKQNHAQEK